MNWDAVGAVAELLGAVGVIVTLLYLAKQIGQSSQMMRATIKQEQSSATQQIIFRWIEHPDLWLALVNDEELSEEKEAQFGLIIRAGLRGMESYCHQSELGLLDEKEWTALKATIQNLCSYRKAQAEYLKLRPELSERLQMVVDPIIRKPANDA